MHPNTPAPASGGPSDRPRCTTRKPYRARASKLAVSLIVLAMLPFVATAQAPQAEPELPAPAVDSDPVVVQLGAMIERLSDIEWRFEVALRSYAAGQGMSYTPEIAAQMRPLLPVYLEQRGTELVLLREADKRGLEVNQENVDVSLERIRSSVPEGEDYEFVLAEAGFDSEARVVTLISEGDLITQVIEAFNEESQPSEDEVRVRYLADIAWYTEPESYCARHILVAEEELADDIVARVRGGEEFADLAAEFGTDGTATAGGDLGCFGRGAMVPDFENAVLEAEIGEVAGPVQTQFGFHALLVYDHHEASVRPYEEVREQVRANLAATTADAKIAGLLRWSGVVTYPERVPGL